MIAKTADIRNGAGTIVSASYHYKAVEKRRSMLDYTKKNCWRHGSRDFDA